MQFDQIPDATVRAHLLARGVRLLDYLPDHAFFASVPDGTSAADLHDAGVRWLGPIYPADKTPPRWQNSGIGAWSLRPGGETELRVKFFSDVAPQAARQAITALDARLLGEDEALSQLTIQISMELIDRLAAIDIVRWVEEIPAPAAPLNDGVLANAQADAVQASPYNLSGAGVVVGEWDVGNIDTTHPDFGGRVILGDATTVDKHSTHVAGTMAGSGVLSTNQGGVTGQWRGVAPAATIVSFTFVDPVPKHKEAINTHGIVLSQNSWGINIQDIFGNCDLLGNYNNLAPEFDRVVTGLYGHPISAVFAAGNARKAATDTSCKVGPYFTINPPGTAKNVITVGAINSDDSSMTSFSSWGPADDGRLKPELVAPGAQVTADAGVTSTQPGNVYGVLFGTSMAAPAVSGAAILLVEDYRTRFNGQNPLPSTVRGLLVHTAQDLDDSTTWFNNGPDYASGYGRLQIKDAVDQLRSNGFLVGQVTHGETNTYILTLPESAPPVKVTLVWDDPAASENASVTLVNDLDLLVFDPASQRYYPWTLDPAHPTAAAIQSQEDHLNNIEQVFVDKVVVSPGNWTVQIVGRNVPVGAPQKYTLVFSPPVIPALPLVVVETNKFEDVTSGNGNGAIEPAETIFQSIVLHNTDGPTASNLTARVSSTTPGLTITQPVSAYPDLLPGSRGTNVTPFAFRLSKSVPCGSTISFTQIVSGDGLVITNDFNYPIGHVETIRRASQDYASAPEPVLIPDAGTLFATNEIGDHGIIDEVQIFVRLDHTWVGDLEVALQHPDSAEVVLLKADGNSGQNFGSGECGAGALFTTFSDQAAVPIAAGTAPFIGLFRPSGSLAAFHGKSLAGNWRLRVSDQSIEDTGTLLCWGMKVNYHVDDYVCTPFNNPPLTADLSVFVAYETSTSFSLVGADVDEDTLTFQTDSLPQHGTLTEFDPHTGAVTYVPEPGYRGPDTFTYSVNDGTINSVSAAVSFTVRGPVADVSLVKTTSAESVIVGRELIYTLIVSNAGPRTANGVLLRDELPSDVEVATVEMSQGKYTFAEGFLQCELGTLEVGRDALVRVTVHAAAAGLITNVASVAAEEIDLDFSNNTNTVVSVAQLEGELSVTKTVDTLVSLVGQPLRFALVVSNAGPHIASGIVLTDTLPPGVELVDATTSQGGYVNEAGVLRFELNDLGVGGTALIQAQMRPGVIGLMTNIARLNSATVDLDLNDNEAQVIVEIKPMAELLVTVEQNASAVVVGREFESHLMVSNRGPSEASGVRLTSEVSAGLELVLAETTQGVCATNELGGATCDLGSLPAGSIVLVRLVLKANGTGLVTNTATVTANEADVDLTNNQGNEVRSAKEEAELTVHQSSDPELMLLGQQLNFTLSVSNAGPSRANGVVLRDELPGGVELVSVETSQGEYSNVLGVLSFQLGVMEAGSTALVRVTVRPTAAELLTNLVSVSAEEIDLNLADNTNELAKVVRLEAELSVSKAVETTLGYVGQPLVFVLIVSNAGPHTAIGVVLSEALPENVRFEEVIASHGSCANEAGLLRCELGELDAGASAEVRVKVTPLVTGLMTNAVQVVSGSVDLDEHDNTAQAVVEVKPAADLMVLLEPGSAAVLVDREFESRVVVSNRGPNEASGVILQQELSGGLELISAEPSQGACQTNEAGLLTCELGSLPADSHAWVKLALKPALVGLATITARVKGNEADWESGNNEAHLVWAVKEQAELMLLLRSTPALLLVDRELTYELEVTNGGPKRANGVVVQNVLPGGVEVVSITASQGACENLAGVVRCEVGVIDVGANALVQLVVRPHAGGMLTNTATVLAEELDLDLSDNTQTVTSEARLESELSVSQTASSTVGLVGQPLIFTMTVSNAGPHVAKGVVLQATLPEGVTVQGVTISQGSYANEAGVLRVEVNELSAGATAEVRVEVSPLLVGSVTNSVQVRAATVDLSVEDDVAQVVVEIKPLADLMVTAAGNSSPVPVGRELESLVVISNQGPNEASGVQLRQEMSTGWELVSVEASQGVCATNESGLTCEIGNLPAGSNVLVRLVLLPTQVGVATNSFAVTGAEADLDLANNLAAAVWSVKEQAELAISQKTTPDLLLLGRELNYTLLVTNAGPRDAHGVVLRDELPAATELVLVEPSQGECTQLADGLRCDLGAIEAGGNAIVRVTIRPTAAGVLTNLTRVTAEEFDSDLTDNASATTDEVRLEAELSVRQIAESAAGTAVGLLELPMTFLLVASNAGPHAASSVVLREELPAGVELIEATPSQGGLSYEPGIVIYNLGALEPGHVAQVEVKLRPLVTGLVTNTVRLNAAEVDFNTDDNESRQTVDIQPVADLAVAAELNLGAVLIGREFESRVVVHNRGPSEATEVKLRDELPPGSDLVSVEVAQGVCLTNETGVVVCDLGSLGQGATVTVRLVMIPRSIGLITNTVTAMSPVYDPTLDDLTATIVTSVIDTPTLSHTRIGNKLVLSWPINDNIFVLEVADSLAEPTTWTLDRNPQVIVGDQIQVTVKIAGTSKFYRLRKE